MNKLVIALVACCNKSGYNKMLISREICICGKNAIDEKVLKIVEIGYLK